MTEQRAELRGGRHHALDLIEVGTGLGGRTQGVPREGGFAQRLVLDGPLDALAAAAEAEVAAGGHGGDVELDREMIELIRDPLTHIVRNAVDHGLEPADERAARRLPNFSYEVNAHVLRVDLHDDRKTAKGKRYNASYGNARSHTASKVAVGAAAPVVKKTVAKAPAKKADAE